VSLDKLLAVFFKIRLKTNKQKKNKTEIENPRIDARFSLIILMENNNNRNNKKGYIREFEVL